MALSVPGTKPAWVELRGGQKSPPSLKTPCQLGQCQARLVYGQVFSEDGVSLMVMKTWRGPA